MPAILDDLLEIELSPMGWLLAAAGGVLALSPETRKTVRRGLVRGVALLLAATEGARVRTAQMRENWEDLVAEARTELETPAEPVTEPA